MHRSHFSAALFFPAVKSLALAVVAIFLGLLVAAPALAGTPMTYNVNDPVDANSDGSCSTGSCTLRDAIDDANAGSDIDTINFSGSHILTGGELYVTQPVVINGQGGTVEQQSGSRVFSVTAGPTTFNDFTLRGGDSNQDGAGILVEGPLELNGMVIDSNESRGFLGGGGVMNLSTIAATNTVFSNNFASGVSGSGGGLFNASGGVFVMNGGSFSGNAANRAGGGIEQDAGAAPGARGVTPLQLTNVSFTNNTVCGLEIVSQRGPIVPVPNPGNGGAIHVTNGQVVIVGGTVVNNCAQREGGGLWNQFPFEMSVTGTTITGNVARGDAPDDGGGGIFDNGGTLVLTDVDITLNQATGSSGSGGGILSLGRIEMSGGSVNQNTANRAGGGIEIARPPDRGIIQGIAHLEILGTLIDNNRALGTPGNGGAIHTADDLLCAIELATITNNQAANEGGGIWIGPGTDVNLVDSTVDLNVSAEGGGLYLQGGRLGAPEASVNVVRSTVSNNQSVGLFRTNAAGEGGGAYISARTVLISSNSTFSGNSASASGGALFFEPSFDRGNVEGGLILNSTIFDNSTANSGGGIFVGAFDGAASVEIGSSVVAGNSAVISGPDISGTLESLDYNLVQDATDAGFNGPTGNNIEGEDPLLGPLADNGGPTLTHLPSPDSPVVDQGSSINARGESTDQRGEARTVDVDDIPNADDGTDIGSVELTRGEGGGSVLEIPVASSWGLAMLGLLLGLFGVVFLRHRA